MENACLLEVLQVLATKVAGVRRRGRGYLLVAAMSVVLMAFVVAISLQYWTSLSRASFFLTEAEFQAEVAVENQVAAELLKLRGIEASPSQPDDLSVKQTAGYNTDFRQQAGSKVFQDRLPDPAFKKPDKEPPEGLGQQILREYQPSSLRPEFRVFGRSRFRLVYSAGFPFAAYAPKGSIQLQQCFPGGNPPEGKIQGKLEEFRSGIPAWLGARSGVTVAEDFPYGEVYQEESSPDTVKLGRPGGALVHLGRLPYTQGKLNYTARLRTQIQQGRDLLARTASRGDKTKFLMGKPVLSAKGLVNCLFSLGDVRLEDVLSALVTPSLNQAMSFPLPVIPTFSTALVYNELTFHVPFPPDQGLFAPLQKKAEELADKAGAKLNQLGEPLQKALEKLDSLQKELDSKVDSAVASAIQGVQGPLDSARKQLNDLEAELVRGQDRLARVNSDLAREPFSQPLQAQVSEAQNQLSRLQGEIDRARGGVAELESRLNRAGDEARSLIQAQYQAPIEEARGKLRQIQQEMEVHLNQARALANESVDALAAALPGDPKGLATRALEEVAAIDAKLGAPGFNYLALGMFFGRANLNVQQRALEQAGFRIAVRFVQLICPAGKLVVNATTPSQYLKISSGFDLSDFILNPQILEAAYRLRKLSIKEALLEYLQPILDSIPFNEVRLINFGEPDCPTAEIFQFENSGEDTLAKGFTSECTWNVPQGRSLALKGNVTIKGDLWVQRGACLHVQGNLRLLRPPARSYRVIDNPLNPSGRIFLEPGATLLVDGNLDVEGGSALFGSVVIEAPLGQASAITSAILCQGDVKLKYGVHPGISLDNLVGYVAETTGQGELKKVHRQLLQPLLTQVAPNVAKIFGPFHIRKPYLASSATTLSLYFIIPGPGPPYPNIMVKVFRVLAAAYGITLNASLGENLYTQSDWWLFGEGAVPIVPRVDAETLLDSLKKIQFKLPLAKDPAAFFKSRLQDFVNKVVVRITTDVISTCIGEVIKAMTSVLQGGKQATAALGVVIDGVLAQFQTSLEELIEEIKREFELAVTDAVKDLVVKPLLELVKDLNRQILASVERSVLRDAPGLMIQAGGNLTIASTEEQSPLALGFFVAGKNVTIQTERCLGSIISLEGSIQARQLTFIPHFTNASLYVPEDKPDWSSAAWPKAAIEIKYGKDFDNGKSVEIGPSLFHLSAQGWTQ